MRPAILMICIVLGTCPLSMHLYIQLFFFKVANRDHPKPDCCCVLNTRFIVVYKVAFHLLVLLEMLYFETGKAR